MFTSACRWQRKLAVRYYIGFLDQNVCANEKLTEMKGPSAIIFQEWTDTRTFSYLKYTLIYNYV